MSEAEQKPDYRATLNLPKTKFPMKANLAKSEVDVLERWRESDLEAALERAGAGRPSYILHDGPPYANGDIHIGHALNKVLKDVIVRHRRMAGNRAPYVPGWDCHGLPIEQRVLNDLGREMREKTPLEIRQLCHQTATKWIGIQREQFKRLGIGGQWDRPYTTIDPAYEKAILTAFRDIVAKGAIYRALKPVFWDPTWKTALAEAEIEYETIKSPSIYVRYPVTNPEKVEGLAGREKLSIVIWTTTPWTLPASLAVSVHPNFDYALAKVGDEHLIVAKDLLEGFCQTCDLPDGEIIRTYKGAELEGLFCRKPMFPDADPAPVLLADHVTLEAGSGCVHTAPGHGMEDYIVCQRYGIKPFVPVDEDGCFTTGFPKMEGMFVWKANVPIIRDLDTRGLLIKSSTIKHEYPHSWRSHQPIIYRATSQWFMDLDKSGIRRRGLELIDGDVQWIPAWGRERIHNMVEGRAEWCLSRQRAWGVPIPAMKSKKTGESILDLAILDKVIERVGEKGTNCWFEEPAAAFVPDGWTGPDGETAADLEQEYDILDVWFDSGASHLGVLATRDDLEWPCDLYLEGSDQHRGWFQSSLLIAVGTRDAAPYRSVLTHGFVLDKNGRQMSKSVGNVVAPQEIIDRLGADVLRLWVISEDYRGDVKVTGAGGEIMQRISDSYRRIRNTIRFMLGALGDYELFDPAKDEVPYDDLELIDKWALGELANLIQRVTKAYETFEFHRVYHLAHRFCVVEMSAVYLDVVKDRLYCHGPADPTRRAAQTVVSHILSAVVRLLAPVLVFTTDEAWQYMQAASGSVHLADLPEVRPEWVNEGVADLWDKLIEVREEVVKALEIVRQNREIGHSLDADVTVHPKDEDAAQVLEGREEFFRDLCIVSGLSVSASPLPRAAGETLVEGARADVAVRKSAHAKCARCWQYRPSVGANADHPDICDRCAEVVTRCYGES